MDTDFWKNCHLFRRYSWYVIWRWAGIAYGRPTMRDCLGQLHLTWRWCSSSIDGKLHGAKYRQTLQDNLSPSTNIDNSQEIIPNKYWIERKCSKAAWPIQKLNRIKPLWWTLEIRVRKSVLRNHAVLSGRSGDEGNTFHHTIASAQAFTELYVCSSTWKSVHCC